MIPESLTEVAVFTVPSGISVAEMIELLKLTPPAALLRDGDGGLLHTVTVLHPKEHETRTAYPSRELPAGPVMEVRLT